MSSISSRDDITSVPGGPRRPYGDEEVAAADARRGKFVRWLQLPFGCAVLLFGVVVYLAPVFAFRLLDLQKGSALYVVTKLCPIVWIFFAAFIVVAAGSRLWRHITGAAAKEKREADWKRANHIHVHAAAVPPVGGDRAQVTGVLVVHEPVTSPFGHERCGAFRLVGSIAHIDVDDSSMGRLSVRDDEGVMHSIESDAATIDLVTKRPHAIKQTEPMKLFFQRLRLPEPSHQYSSRRTAKLAEARLFDGDRVILEGHAQLRGAREPEPRPGYRAQRGRNVWIDLPDSPLVLRKAPALD